MSDMERLKLCEDLLSLTDEQFTELERMAEEAEMPSEFLQVVKKVRNGTYEP